MHGGLKVAFLEIWGKLGTHPATPNHVYFLFPEQIVQYVRFVLMMVMVERSQGLAFRFLHNFPAKLEFGDNWQLVDRHKIMRPWDAQ